MKIPLKGVALIVCVFLSSSLSIGQEKTRTRRIALTSTGAPVAIVGLDVFGQKRQGDSFVVNAPRGWFADLKINIKNTSQKQIVYLELELEVPKQGKMLQPISATLTFGAYPKAKGDVAEFYRTQVLNPMETGSIVVLPNIAERLIQFEADYEIDIDSVELSYGLVAINDGTAWLKGTQLRQDPNNPLRWNRIDLDR